MGRAKSTRILASSLPLPELSPPYPDLLDNVLYILLQVKNQAVPGIDRRADIIWC